MGIKALKEKFNIEHIVCKTKKGVCIGSSYIHDLAIINLKTGLIFITPDFSNMFRSEYPALFAAKSDEILAILNSDDDFKQSLPVYVFIGDTIVEKFCEEHGWPNTTHDGLLMYENEFFANKMDAIKHAIKNRKWHKKALNERIKYYEGLISESHQSLKNEEQILNNLTQMLSVGEKSHE